jgi:hypothetical protein
MDLLSEFLLPMDIFSLIGRVVLLMLFEEGESLIAFWWMFDAFVVSWWFGDGFLSYKLALTSFIVIEG